MTYYIECYYPDGKQILGNMDGQAVLRCRNYHRCLAYKRIKDIISGKIKTLREVTGARVVNGYGSTLEKLGTEA